MGSACTKNKIHEENTINYNKNNEILLNWEAHNIEKYHWWPMRDLLDRSLNNNLYADNGGLFKYDLLFNTKSQNFQKLKYYRENDSKSSDARWAGFCDKAAKLSCLFPYPKRDVIIEYHDKKISFNKKDIETLMIIAVDNAINKNLTLFLGKRNNSKKNEKCKDEPYPSELLNYLNILCSDNKPFVMDIDNGVSVWNYSYNKVVVSKTKECLIPHVKPQQGIVNYYNFQIISSAYPSKNINIWGMENIIKSKTEIGTIEFKKESWISNNNPDFLWKVFSTKTCWEGKCKINPEVNAKFVYLLYKFSNNSRHQILNIDNNF